MRMRTTAEALLSALRVADAIGVTRLADVTGFDRIGIPVWQAVRPASRSLAVHQGKGASSVTARISAVMEAFEHWCAEQVAAGEVRIATPAEAVLWAGQLRPRFAHLLTEPIAWLPGRDLLNDCAASAPRGVLNMDFTASDAGFGTNSTGTAAGSSREEARLAALCELAERAADHRFRTMTLAERMERLVDPSTLRSRRCRWAVARIERAGFRLLLWRISDDPSVAAMAAAIYDDVGAPFPLKPAVGSAARLSLEQAAFSAMIEAAQIRVTLIAGARDDLGPYAYPIDVAAASAAGLRHRLQHAGLRGAGRPLPPQPDQPRTLPEANWVLLAHLAGLGAPAVIEVDITVGDSGLSAVHIFAPGLPDGTRN
jgi:ribosomal protein S12 methylthiotransferase accessory factor